MSGKGAINISDEDVEGLYGSLDLNCSGNIDYTEFLAAFTNNEHYKKEKYLKSVFKKIDKVSLQQIKKIGREQ